MKSDNHLTPLDSYEVELIDAIDANSFVPKKIDPERKAALQEAAAKTIDEINTKRQISIKISERDLIRIRQRANAVSIPYQNIIQSLLRKYASGEIRLEI
jgi:predicted DNA binding CopG/RHH family protein